MHIAFCYVRKLDFDELRTIVFPCDAYIAFRVLDLRAVAVAVLQIDRLSRRQRTEREFLARGGSVLTQHRGLTLVFVGRINPIALRVSLCAAASLDFLEYGEGDAAHDDTARVIDLRFQTERVAPNLKILQRNLRLVVRHLVRGSITGFCSAAAAFVDVAGAAAASRTARGASRTAGTACRAGTAADAAACAAAAADPAAAIARCHAARFQAAGYAGTRCAISDARCRLGFADVIVLAIIVSGVILVVPLSAFVALVVGIGVLVTALFLVFASLRAGVRRLLKGLLALAVQDSFRLLELFGIRFPAVRVLDGVTQQTQRVQKVDVSIFMRSEADFGIKNSLLLLVGKGAVLLRVPGECAFAQGQDAAHRNDGFP